MGESAAATITEAIEGYKAQDVDRVLDQFHDEALIVGTRENERWDSKVEVREALEYELSHVAVEGPMTDTGAEESFVHPVTDDLAIYFRDGYVVFNGKRIRGRWSAALKADEEGDWKIVHSHFSLAEGHTTPNGSEESA